MSALFDLAKEIVRRDTERPSESYSHIVSAINGEIDWASVSDRELVTGALFALRSSHQSIAVVALGELDLRLTAAEYSP